MPPVRVLIVEDDDADYQITAGMLASQDRTEFEVDRAASFDEGVERMRARAHDVYLVDHRLGRGTGLELIRAALSQIGAAPILMLTGYDEYAVDLEAAQLGATDFLLKHRLSPELLERSIRYSLRQHQMLEDLRKSEAECVVAREEAEAASQAKSEFLSRVTHELRTPLTAILGFGQLLDFEELSPRQQECANEILLGGEHLLQLINEILDLSRIESGTISVSLEPVRISEAITSAISMLRPIAQDAGVRLAADPGDCGAVKVLADDQRLRQILLNLLSNAVKYNKPGGFAKVSLRRVAGPQLEVEIEDDGRGMSPEQLKKLFTPFERLGLEASEIEGTGLGMALSLRLLEAMGGTIDVRSDVGAGTTITVDLPLAEEDGEPGSRVAAKVAAAHRRGPGLPPAPVGGPSGGRAASGAQALHHGVRFR